MSDEDRRHRIECPNCCEQYVHCTWAFVAEVLRRGDCPECREEEDIPINLTIEDMEWDAEMAFGYDGWDDEEGI